MSSATALADRLPSSGTSKLLGQRILDFDATASCVRVSFVATSDFLNPAGFIQGGILAAMIDDSMGPSVWLTTEGKIFPVTIDLTVSYLGAARRGSIFGEARVVQLGKTIAFQHGCQLLAGVGDSGVLIGDAHLRISAPELKSLPSVGTWRRNSR